MVAAERKFKRPKAKSRVPIIGTRSSEDVQGQNTASGKDAELLNKMAAWADEAEKSEPSDDKVDLRKPHAARVDANDGGGDEMEIDNEGDYVYDTYVRHLVAADTELEVVGEGAVGHLIISEEDQDLWDAYIEDEDGSEKEFDTDSEDSNGSFYLPITLLHSLHSTSINHILTTHPHTAEDYYGADYPEDEVAEDDEYGRGAYEEYRKYASDDEQWGNGLDSDDDGVVGSGDENGEFSTGQVFARVVRRDKTKTASAKVQTDVDGGEEMSE